MAAATASISAQWPTACVALNDIVEQHLGNDGNVGIYQRTFGEQAEEACRSRPRETMCGRCSDGPSAHHQRPDSADDHRPQTPDIGGWPTTCVELNDIVERHLGNDHNVGIYQRTFEDRAEHWCQLDHRGERARHLRVGAAAHGTRPDTEAPQPIRFGQRSGTLPTIFQLLRAVLQIGSPLAGLATFIRGSPMAYPRKKVA